MQYIDINVCVLPKMCINQLFLQRTTYELFHNNEKILCSLYIYMRKILILCNVNINLFTTKK